MQDANREIGANEPEFIAVLQRRWTKLSTEYDRLDTEKARVDRELGAVKNEMVHLKGLMDIHKESAGGGALVGPTLVKSAETVADAVARLIAERGEALHYRDIEREMRARGLYTAGGADPANTLLAKYFNDPRLYRPERGKYALREWQPNAASVGTKRVVRNRRGA
jgi:hypothetical protein